MDEKEAASMVKKMEELVEKMKQKEDSHQKEVKQLGITYKKGIEDMRKVFENEIRELREKNKRAKIRADKEKKALEEEYCEKIQGIEEKQQRTEKFSQLECENVEQKLEEKMRLQMEEFKLERERMHCERKSMAAEVEKAVNLKIMAETKMKKLMSEMNIQLILEKEKNGELERRLNQRDEERNRSILQCEALAGKDKQLRDEIGALQRQLAKSEEEKGALVATLSMRTAEFETESGKAQEIFSRLEGKYQRALYDLEQLRDQFNVAKTQLEKSAELHAMYEQMEKSLKKQIQKLNLDLGRAYQQLQKFRKESYRPLYKRHMMLSRHYLL